MGWQSKARSGEGKAFKGKARHIKVWECQGRAVKDGTIEHRNVRSDQGWPGQNWAEQIIVRARKCKVRNGKTDSTQRRAGQRQASSRVKKGDIV